MMKERRSPSHGSREQGFELPYQLARKQLARITDLEEQCRRSGARYMSPDKIIVDYLNRPYHIALPDIELSLEDSPCSVGIEVPLTDKILILHYFNQAQGTPATGRLITFKQIPGGVSYYPAFFQRVIAPLVNRFGKNPDLLMKAATRFGGYKAPYGDISVTIDAFPRVPVTLVLWKGDEEVAPAGNVLFDANISDYLPTENVAALCGNIVWKMVKGIPSA